MKFPFKTSKLTSICEYIPFALDNNLVTIASIKEAPKWLRLLSRESYCSYKNVVYVPEFHSLLVSSEKEDDRNLATAKLCPLFALQQDCKNNVTFLTSFKYLYFLNYQVLYFLYEFFFLKTINHRLLDLIALGFMSSRRKFIFKLSAEEVKALLKEALENT